MVINAFFIGISGVTFLVFPEWSIAHLGMPAFVNSEWYARFCGLILCALAMHVWTTARSAADGAFQRNAIVMVIISASVASSLYVAPGQVTGLRLFAVVVGGLWSLLYAVTLPIKTVGLHEAQEATQ